MTVSESADFAHLVQRLRALARRLAASNAEKPGLVLSDVVDEPRIVTVLPTPAPAEEADLARPW